MRNTKKAKVKIAATPAPMPGSRARHAAFIVLAAVVGLGGGYALWQATHPAPQLTTDDKKVEPAARAKSTKPAVSQDTSHFQKLKGKWRRPDGGYVVDVISVDEKGKIEATYLNPQPIQVSKAEASQDGETIKMFLELSGKNYAGSTYDLTYDPASDQLTGSYYQAVLQQRFDVTFARMAEE